MASSNFGCPRNFFIQLFPNWTASWCSPITNTNSISCTLWYDPVTFLSRIPFISSDLFSLQFYPADSLSIFEIFGHNRYRPPFFHCSYGYYFFLFELSKIFVDKHVTPLASIRRLRNSHDIVDVNSFIRDLTKLRWRRKRQRHRQRAIGLVSKTTTLHVYYAFLYISLPSLHDYDVKWPNFIIRVFEDWNGKAINSTIPVWTRVWPPLFSSNLNPLLLSNWATWDNLEMVWKDAKSIFQQGFHGHRRCRIVRFLLSYWPREWASNSGNISSNTAYMYIRSSIFAFATSTWAPMLRVQQIRVKDEIGWRKFCVRVFFYHKGVCRASWWPVPFVY